jgi:hypothetical protein
VAGRHCCQRPCLDASTSDFVINERASDMSIADYPTVFDRRSNYKMVIENRLENDQDMVRKWQKAGVLRNTESSGRRLNTAATI